MLRGNEPYQVMKRHGLNHTCVKHSEKTIVWYDTAATFGKQENYKISKIRGAGTQGFQDSSRHKTLCLFRTHKTHRTESGYLMNCGLWLIV